jgi:hypothetical protein
MPLLLISAAVIFAGLMTIFVLIRRALNS